MKYIVKKAFLFTSFLLMILSANADETIDSIPIFKQKLLTSVPIKERLRVMCRLSELLNKKGDFEALSYGVRAFELAKHFNRKKAQAAAANRIGVVYEDNSDYKQALYYFLLSRNICKEVKNWKGFAGMNNNIGGVYKAMGDPDRAYWYFNQALIMNRSLGNKNEMGGNLGNIGVIFLDKRNTKQAKFYLNQALQNAVATQNVSEQIMSLICLADAYRLEANYIKALEYCDSCISLVKRSSHLSSFTLAYRTKGEVYANMKKYPEAESYYKMALDEWANRHTSGMISSVSEIYLNLSVLYDSLSKPELAFEYFKKYHTLNDSLFNVKKVKEVYFMAAMHESSKKDEQIKSLNKDKEIAFAKAEKKELFTNFIIVISILIIVISLFFARNLILKHRIKNKLLNEEKALVEVQKKKIERDNARLMHENIAAKYEVLKSKINPHFLFNSLATLSSIMPKESYKAEEFIEHFSDFYRKIIETTEEELIPLKEELKIVEKYLYLQQMEFDTNLVIDVSIGERLMNLFVPPFAVQMVVENAIKHNEISNDFPLKISIFTYEDSLVISNTIQRKITKQYSTGIGEKNIIERYKLFTDKNPEFQDARTDYIVTLPLLKGKEHKDLV